MSGGEKLLLRGYEGGIFSVSDLNCNIKREESVQDFGGRSGARKRFRGDNRFSKQFLFLAKLICDSVLVLCG